MRKKSLAKENPQVALVYDRVNTPFGGAEKVLLALQDIFPDAPLYTSVYDPDQANWAKKSKVRTTWLQQLPGSSSHHRSLAPLMPLAFEQLDFTDFDIIISVTSAEAKGVLTLPTQLHLCYLLTPTRYLYSHYDEYTKSSKIPTFFLKPFLDYLRWWDQVAINRPDFLLPISQLVADRITTFHSTHPPVLPPLYPPVEPKLLQKNLPALPENFAKYALVVSRLVSYKKVDLAIKACATLKHPLIIVGEGPEKNQLQKLAQNYPQAPILFLEKQPDQKVSQLMQHASVLLMPGVEDFGITALEALAHHTPAIVHHQSGVAELIQDGITGIHLQESTVNGLMKAIKQAANSSFSQRAMAEVVTNHSTAAFKKQFEQVVTTLWRKHYVTTS